MEDVAARSLWLYTFMTSRLAARTQIPLPASSLTGALWAAEWAATGDVRGWLASRTFLLGLCTYCCQLKPFGSLDKILPA